jgi:phage baseplate assembly protein W
MAEDESALSALGCDLDISTGDFTMGPGGDLVMVASLAALQQRLYLRALTAAGSLLLHPTYGIGLGQLVARPLTAAQLTHVQGALSAQLALEPAITSVVSVDLEQPDSRTLRISVLVEVAGRTQPALLSTALSTLG